MGKRVTWGRPSVALVVDSNGFAPFPEFLLKGGLHGPDLGLTSAPMTGSRGVCPGWLDRVVLVHRGTDLGLSLLLRE